APWFQLLWRTLGTSWRPILCVVIAAALLATFVNVPAFGPRAASAGTPASDLGNRGRATFATASAPSVPPTPTRTVFERVGVVLPNGSPGEADSVHARAPFVLRDDDATYKMWYMGYDGYRFRMLYATSPDGIHWLKHGVIMDVGVPPYNWDSVGGQSVLKIQSVYHMWFSAGYWSGGPFVFWAQIYHAVSMDGPSWNVTGVTLPPNPSWHPGMTNAPWGVSAGRGASGPRRGAMDATGPSRRAILCSAPILLPPSALPVWSARIGWPTPRDRGSITREGTEGLSRSA